MKKVDLETAIQTGAKCACFNLRKTSRLITQVYEKYMRPVGLRATQFTVLMVVRALEPSTVNKLAKVLEMDRTSLGRNLKPLERNGYVHIKPGTDRRERVVALTPAGHKALVVALPAWQKAQDEVERTLGSNRLSGLLLRLQQASTVLAGVSQNR